MEHYYLLRNTKEVVHCMSSRNTKDRKKKKLGLHTSTVFRYGPYTARLNYERLWQQREGLKTMKMSLLSMKD